jgi:lipoprotein NlpI
MALRELKISGPSRGIPFTDRRQTVVANHGDVLDIHHGNHRSTCTGLADYGASPIEPFRQAIRIKPQYADAWNNIGLAYGNIKRYNDAIEAYRQALRINPKYADVWFNFGEAYAITGNRTAAMEAVRVLRRLDPAQADKLFNLIVPR